MNGRPKARREAAWQEMNRAGGFEDPGYWRGFLVCWFGPYSGYRQAGTERVRRFILRNIASLILTGVQLEAFASMSSQEFREKSHANREQQVESWVTWLSINFPQGKTRHLKVTARARLFAAAAEHIAECARTGRAPGTDRLAVGPDDAKGSTNNPH